MSIQVGESFYFSLVNKKIRAYYVQYTVLEFLVYCYGGQLKSLSDLSSINYVLYTCVFECHRA